MNKENIKEVARRAIEFIVDTIAPPSPDVRRIERMTVEEFISKALQTDVREHIEDIQAFLPYRADVVRCAIVEIKDRPNKKIARLLGKVLYEFLRGELEDLRAFENFTRPVIIPVPITKKKKRKRGWNQCELILDGLAKVDRGHIFEIRNDVLEKIKETDDQVGKTKEERHLNVKGSFAPRDRRVARGRNIIIFDDIVTTGATLREAKKALIDAGARRVICVALAH